MSETGDRIIDATMRLLSDRPFEEVTLSAIADEAGVSLATLAAHFPTRGHILDAFARRIDREVLARDFSDMADQKGRDRLFDVLMSRLDSLAPYRAALKSLMMAVRRDPALALGLNAIAVRSAVWMMAAAGMAPTGWRGRLVSQGLAVSFARVLRTFVDEDDPGLPRTMAALDRELREAEERHRRFVRFFGEAVREAPARDAPVPDAEIVTQKPEGPAPAPAATGQEPAGARVAEAEREEIAPEHPATAPPAPDGPGTADATATGKGDRDTPEGDGPVDEKTHP